MDWDRTRLSEDRLNQAQLDSLLEIREPLAVHGK